MVFMSFVTNIKTAVRYINEHTAYYIIFKAGNISDGDILLCICTVKHMYIRR